MVVGEPALHVRSGKINRLGREKPVKRCAARRRLAASQIPQCADIARKRRLIRFIGFGNAVVDKRCGRRALLRLILLQGLAEELLRSCRRAPFGSNRLPNVGFELAGSLRGYPCSFLPSIERRSIVHFPRFGQSHRILIGAGELFAGSRSAPHLLVSARRIGIAGFKASQHRFNACPASGFIIARENDCCVEAVCELVVFRLKRRKHGHGVFRHRRIQVAEERFERALRIKRIAGTILPAHDRAVAADFKQRKKRVALGLCEGTLWRSDEIMLEKRERRQVRHLRLHLVKEEAARVALQVAGETEDRERSRLESPRRMHRRLSTLPAGLEEFLPRHGRHARHGRIEKRSGLTPAVNA